ncbi:DUF2125 domain-containing protein [Fuscovulum blasticum]|uniref:DUF2125 domain-containing protein n=1 Tax=Fuscovulum blasticum TaxID=1075 RepID=UPI000D3EC96B|nr:DUF2125 domain-containing protein [Fuscovulum blasticum]AWD22674.1 hypothetical protein B6K69_14160 [Fuscovulum blasticum]
MRWLGWLAGIGALLWSGLWYGGSVLIHDGVEGWFQQQAAHGITAEKTALAVTGFPGRFDLGITGLRLADPATGTGWLAPELHVFAQSWKPWHLTAALPPTQTVTLPGETVTVTGQALAATLGSAPSPDVPLTEVTLTGDRLDLRSDAGWTLGLGEFAVTLRVDPDSPPGGYLLTFDLAPLTPDPALLARVRAVTLPDLPHPDFPDAVEALAGTIHLQFSAPLDRHAADRQPLLNTVEIAEAGFTWGQLSLAATGTVQADAQGFAAGRIELALTNWDRLPGLLVAAGVVQPGVGPTVGNMLRALAGQTPDPAVLKLPLVLQDGRMSLGPFPLGPAPQMHPPTG